MSTYSDETLLWLIGDCFRNKLRNLIQVEPVLDYIHFIERDKKDVILNKAKSESNHRAVDMLIDTIIAMPRRAGWFREFLNALMMAGCKYAARIVDSDENSSPDMDAENDYCVQLINLLAPSLVRMKTADVCLVGYALDILNADDKENIEAETRNRGNMSGARVLLRRIVQKPPGWFSTFLEVLRKTGHPDLIRELTGTPPSELTCVNGNENQIQGTPIGNLNGLDHAISTPTEIELYCSDVSHEEDLDQDEDVDSAEAGGHGAADGAAADAGEADIALWDYQMEVAKPALQGKNVIISLPTGSGKTRVALHITKDHLDHRKQQGLPGKVAVLVNRVVLVEQHYNKEFSKLLKHRYCVERISGESKLKLAFSEMVKTNDVIICTDMILENFLARAMSEEDNGINLSDFSLIIIDECHHTQKGDVYQQILIRYLTQKFKNEKNRKERKPELPLPQILGLTASLGVGGASQTEKAQEHILRICANLDASAIMTADLSDRTKGPFKKVKMASRRQQDPFGDVIREIMKSIEEHARLRPSAEPGTQCYELWVVDQEKQAAREGDQRIRVCSKHLRQYNEALVQSNTIRMADAFGLLHKFYKEEYQKKYPTEEGERVRLTDTEKFLFKLFQDKKQNLRDLVNQPQFENRALALLRETILHEFTSRNKARGIIFTETRLSAIALHHWIQQNDKFEEAEVRSSYLIGGGDQSAVRPMTSRDKDIVLGKFRSGEINLLVATTVAEEGLDIEECNVVIRYCLVTNEIAMIQARGRGRAEDSSYIVIGVEGSGVSERERVNESREKIMTKAIQRVQQMSQKEYQEKVKTYQLEAILEKKCRTRRSEEKKKKKKDPSSVRLRCRGCEQAVSPGTDVEVISGAHHVIMTDDFKKKFRVLKTKNQTLPQAETKVVACKGCGHNWGFMMCHRGIDCPCINIPGFVVSVNGDVGTFDSWTDLDVEFPAFDYFSHASRFMFDSDEEISS
ncbi:interferon-induced helicase C domain-containing protein 1-like [Chanos chanos]|uniref:RNA helicase n=1 Tax=Chanos chanos TaxID=29144 RepID=A0A6J2VX73_CHACN|nr:interferon-induced helicase C domain-containing protein 1-like [Chanos chanos]